MSRAEVAREAARILYNRTVKEYKEAKEAAASSLGTKAIPSNYEVVIELDNLTEQLEGSDRHIRLIEMRGIALELMKKLRDYNPVLIGSVWRGTIRLGSDIDIVLYHDNPAKIKTEIEELYPVTVVTEKTFTVNGLPLSSAHIEFKAGTYTGEVVVRPVSDIDAYRDERCETYGDRKKGLSLAQLEKLIEIDPLRRFIPKRRRK